MRRLWIAVAFLAAVFAVMYLLLRVLRRRTAVPAGK